MAIEITTYLSEALIDLVQAGQAPIDAIEVGPWYSPRQIRAYQRRLPGWAFYFHAGSFISRMRWMPGSVARLKRYLACTQTRWVSIHVELLPWPVYLLATHLGLYLPPPDAGRARARFCRDVGRLARRVPLPLIVENLPSLPGYAGRGYAGRGYAGAADPAAIGAIVEETGSGFLLDVAHARVAAANQGVDVHRYLDRLPLERAVQIHTSGPRRREGAWFDAHESLDEEDWALLAWVLERTRPEVVTLEYYRQGEVLREQLARLREVVGDGNEKAHR